MTNSLDYEEYLKFWEEIKDFPATQRHDLIGEKYGGIPHFCQFCGVFMSVLWFHCQMGGCKDCDQWAKENWYNNENKTIEIYDELIKRAKTKKHKEAWEYYRDKKIERDKMKEKKND